MSKQTGLGTLTIAVGSLLAFFPNAANAAVLYNFINFQGPGAGMNAGAGTNMNGIANNGNAVGFAIGDNGNLTNFVRASNGAFNLLNLPVNPTTMALGINSAGDVVGTEGTAFFLLPGGSPQTLTTSGTASTAFGINDTGNIVGQFTTATNTPGFYMASSAGNNFIQINAPAIAFANVVNAQGINNNGLIVGFYQGTDGNVHGFDASVSNAVGGILTGTPIADPTIPSVPGEPGATFVFSQILGINDSGIAVGYYGDSTLSQHGFFYNTHTGQYTFLDDPAEGFNNGVEVTQITGITNSGEISGFYTDANGIFHGFVGTPAPEPASLALIGLGCIALGLKRKIRR